MRYIFTILLLISLSACTGINSSHVNPALDIQRAYITNDYDSKNLYEIAKKKPTTKKSTPEEESIYAEPYKPEED